MKRHRRTPPQVRRSGPALVMALDRDEWELAALLLLEALANVTRTLPPGTIDDLLALISDAEARDAQAR